MIEGKPILISYCPLCGSGMAFDPVVEGRKLTFGVSGLLYKSDVLMYDHQSESLWSQIKQEAVTGKMTGKRLRLLPLLHTTWGAWKKEHHTTRVLSSDTGYDRNYSKDPYADYAKSPRLVFPVGQEDSRFSPKEWIIGIEVEGETKAYPYSELAKGPKHFSDRIGSQEIHIHFDASAPSATIRDRNQQDLPSVMSYWFAWRAFYPQTEVYRFSETDKSLLVK